MTKKTKTKSTYKSIPGIHIQWPWSRLLITGKKSVETRGYCLSEKYIGIKLALIETPGPNGLKEAKIEKSRIIGTITFENCFLYLNEEQWKSDQFRHSVPNNDPNFGFGKRLKTWGWIVKEVQHFKKTYPPPEIKGIVYARNCKIPSSF
jgi:hypothetical protein